MGLINFAAFLGVEKGAYITGMTTSDDLFRLIKSLNKNEKSYFKKFAQLHILGEENTYILLFDAVDAQEKYSEKALIETFGRGKSSSQFSVLKNYLYNLILKSLRVYHADASIRSELKAQLQNVSILFEKGLHAQAQKLLRRCRKTAEEAELFREWIEISGLEQTMLLFGKSYDTGTIKAMNAMLDERGLVLRKMQNTYDYDRLEYNLTSLLQAAGPSSKAGVKKILGHALLKSEKQALCVVSQLKFHHILSTFYYYNGKARECTQHLQQELNILEAHPPILNLRMQDYVLLTNNLLLLLLELGDCKNFDVRLSKFRGQLSTLKPSTRLWEQAIAHNWITEMLRHYKEFNYAKILAASNNLKAHLKANNAELNLYDNFQHLDLLSRAALQSAKAGEALSYNLELLNHPEAPKKFKNYPFARLLNLMIHFELGNYDLLSYSIPSFQRQMAKGRAELLFTSIISFLKKYPSATHRKHRIQLAGKLLNELKKTPPNRYFDFVKWAETKVQH